MKKGDLVRLKKNRAIPGALTALKFYKRLFDEVGEKDMLVLETFETKDSFKSNLTVLVLVNGYKKVINSTLIEVVSETR